MYHLYRRTCGWILRYFDENMLIGDAAADLDAFMEMYGVEAISKEYL